MRAQHHYWAAVELCPYNWRRLWEGLRVGAGGGEVNPLASRDSRGFLHLWRHRSEERRVGKECVR